ncbi:MAG: hypothetical protein ABS920_14595, partial [Sporosarcina sp.]
MTNVDPVYLDIDLKQDNYLNEMKFRHGDNIPLTLRITDKGKPFDLSAVSTASLAITRLDKAVIVLDGTISGNEATFILGGSELAISGRLEAVAQFYDVGGRVSTATFSLYAVKDPTGNGFVPQEREATLIEVVLGDGPLVIQQAKDARDEANQAAAYADNERELTQAEREATTLVRLATEEERDATEIERLAIRQQQSVYEEIADAKLAEIEQTAIAAEENSTAAVTTADEAKTTAIEVRGEFDQVIAEAGSNNPEIVNARGNFQTLKQRLDDTGAKLEQTERQTSVLSTGVSVVNGEVNTPASVEIEGRTLVNLLGRDGNFEKDSNGDGVADGWSSLLFGAVPSIESSNVYGEKSQRITSTPSDTGANRNIRKDNVHVDAGKHYVLAVDVETDGSSLAQLRIDANVGTVPTTSKTSVKKSTVNLKFNPTASGDIFIRIYNLNATGVVGWVQFDGARLYEVAAEEYNKIGVEWNDEEVARRYPYNDDVKHLQGVGVLAEGDNLFPPFTEWTLHANAKVISPYEITHNAAVSYEFSSITLNLEVGKTYRIALDEQTGYVEYMYNGVYIGALVPGSGRNFTPTHTKVTFRTGSSGPSQALKFKNPMLTLGDKPKPFVPRNPSSIIADVKLGAIGTARDTLYEQDGRWLLRKVVEKDVVLDGSHDWLLTSDREGYKNFGMQASVSLPFLDRQAAFSIKNNGKVIKYTGTSSTIGPDSFAFYSLGGALGNGLSFGNSDVDTGFGESYFPGKSDIKRYFNGWKYTDGSVWNSVTGNGQTATAQQAL